MNKKLLAIALLFVTTLFLNVVRADSAPSLSLQSLAKQLGGQSAFQSSLLQEKQIAGMTRALRAEGELFFDPAQGVYYRLSKPVRAQYLISKGMIAVQEGNGKTRRYTPDMWPGLAAIGALFNGVFSGEWQVLEKHFDIALAPSPTQPEQSETGWVLSLIPRDEKLRAALPRLEVNGHLHIEQIQFMDAQGAMTRMSLAVPTQTQGWPEAASQMVDP